MHERVLLAGLMAVGCAVSAHGQALRAWRVADEAVSPPQSSIPLGQIETGSDGRAGFYVSETVGGKPVEIGLYLAPESKVDVPSGRAGSRRLPIVRGSVLVHYVSGGGTGPALAVVAADSWVRLMPGSMLWVDVGGDAGRFTLAEGRATRFTGAPPAGELAAALGGEELAASEAARERAAEIIGALQSARLTWAVGEWVSLAELADIVPRTRERVWSPTLVRSLVSTTSVVTPRTAASTVTPQVTTSAAVTPALTQAQALLASGNPASVVVGARLERTRIVGNPGAAGVGSGSGVRFNPQARPPLQLGVPVR